MCRHIFAWWGGEDKDPETGFSHLAHAACCLLFLMEFQRNGWGRMTAEARWQDFTKDDGRAVYKRWNGLTGPWEPTECIHLKLA